MFTGLVEAMGEITAVEPRGGDRRFVIRTPAGFLEGAALGDSIAVSGVCLTAVAFDGDGFAADVSVETLTATTAGDWAVGRPVNLEHSLTLAKPLGGHLVSGHVDGIGRLVEKHEDARSWRLRFQPPAALARYIARKGSVTIDGISLTVNEVDDYPANGSDAGRTVFGVNIVPHTWTHTTLGTLDLNGAVNLEVDLLARYLERLLTDPTRAGETS
jgi:riboflavin synthase